MYIRIDGKQVEAKKWDTVLSAARRAGIDIPSLCYHPALEPVSACRLCVVEVYQPHWTEKKTVAACEYRVSPNLEVYTRTDSVLKSRRTTIDLLMARAPGSDLLQKLSVENGLPATSHPEVKGAGDCILCLLCVRACEQMGCHAISVSGRGEHRVISAPFADQPDSCVGCGACARICPTGCIDMKMTPTTISIWGREFERERCDSCGTPIHAVAYSEYAIANRELADDYYQQCPECKRKETARKFSGLVIKVQHG